jgi:uncharacterized membrane protein YphA (DoxX/SURF4 family)
MTLLRAAARTMLASYFIASGVKALRDPDPLVPDAEPLTDKMVPFVKEYAPAQVASFIPDDAKTLVRVHGATQLVGGLALASGKGRRLGALLLAYSLIPGTIAKHPFWSRTDEAERAHDQHQFLKNTSLLGGVLVAAADTEGKPSLAWRAQKGGKTLAKGTSKATGKLAKRAESLTEGGSDLAESALATGAALVGTVVASTKKARKQATKQFARAQEAAAKQAEEARKAAAKAARQARKDAPKQLRAARKLAAAKAQEARELAVERAKEAQKAAAERAKEAQKEAAARAKQARKEGRKRARHIQLGEN